MNRLKQIAGLFAIAVLLAGPPPAVAYTPAPASTIPELTNANFDVTLAASALPVLVQFKAEWCGYCRRMQPYLEDLRKAKAGKLNIYRVDVDAQSALAQRYKVRNIPTLIVFQKGVAGGRSNAVVKGPELEAWVGQMTGEKPKPGFSLSRWFKSAF